MTYQRDFDDLLREWADHGDERLPDRYLQAALLEIETTRQRGAWRVPLEGLLMRLQPAAPVLGVAAVAIAAVALYLAFAGTNVGDPDPTPEPTAATRMVEGAYATSVFNVPFTARLEGAASVDGWAVRETPTLISLTPDADSGYEVLVLERAATSLVTAAGAEPLSPDLVAALNAVDGVEAEPMQRPDLDEPATLIIDGIEVPHVEARLTGRPNTDAMFSTTGGEGVQQTVEGGIWWLFDVDRGATDGIVVVYRGSDDPPRWFGTVAAFLESIEFNE